MKQQNYEDKTKVHSIIAAFVFVQFFLHLLAVFQNPGFRSGLLHLLAFQYDIVFLVGFGWAFNRLSQRIPGYEVVLSLIFLVLPLYPFLLDEFLAFPVNIFAADLSLLPFFLANIAGLKGLLIAVFSLCTAWTFYRYQFTGRFSLDGRLVKAAFIIGFIGIVANAGNAGFLETLPNPLVHSIVQTLKDGVLGSSRVVPELVRPGNDAKADFDEEPVKLPVESEYRHILILVMETVNQKDFVQKLNEKSFKIYENNKEHSLVFQNYHTTNLDSYTSLISMLNSEQVPYRAYEQPELFKPVNQKKGLVNQLQKVGWKSLFVCTSFFQPFIPVEDHWDVIVHGKDLPDQEKWVQVGQNRVEAGIEDKAAASTILEFVKKNDKALVMHEMVYGHSPRWMDLTGKSQLEYYDEYFCELYRGLQNIGVAQQTLMIIVADHGERRRADEKEFYRVPLLIIGKNVKPGINKEMYSHLDLAAMIRHFAFAGSFPEPRTQQLVIGHTGRWTYGRISADGEAVFLDARSGSLLGSGKNDQAMEAHQMMQGQINHFARFHKR
ncbi:MAG: sulfatase-like hydrolase/transferase [Candidatus Rifleibacteriota bacterium]